MLANTLFVLDLHPILYLFATIEQEIVPCLIIARVPRHHGLVPHALCQCVSPSMLLIHWFAVVMAYVILLPTAHAKTHTLATTANSPFATILLLLLRLFVQQMDPVYLQIIVIVLQITLATAVKFPFAFQFLQIIQLYVHQTERVLKQICVVVTTATSVAPANTLFVLAKILQTQQFVAVMDHAFSVVCAAVVLVSPEILVSSQYATD